MIVTVARGRACPAESSQRPPPRSNACFTGKLAGILPTSESTREACQRIRAYVEPICKSRALLLDDTVALKTNLSTYTVVTYETLQGNLWVKQQLTNWPVVIAGDAITTERRWEGIHLRVIACWRSPANPARPWVLYAAQNERDVVGINVNPAQWFLNDRLSDSFSETDSPHRKDGLEPGAFTEASPDRTFGSPPSSGCPRTSKCRLPRLNPPRRRSIRASQWRIARGKPGRARR
jgi:hypothetical protein